MAVVFLANGLGCTAILSIGAWKRAEYRRRMRTQAPVRVELSVATGPGGRSTLNQGPAPRRAMAALFPANRPRRSRRPFAAGEWRADAGHELDADAWQQGTEGRDNGQEPWRRRTVDRLPAKAGSCDGSRSISTSSGSMRPFSTIRFRPIGRCASMIPIHRMPDGSYFLSRYDDCAAVYRDPGHLELRQESRFPAQPRRQLALRAPHHQPGVQRSALSHPGPQAAGAGLHAAGADGAAAAHRGAGRPPARSRRRARQHRPDRGLRGGDPAAAHRRHAGRAGRRARLRCATGRSRSSARSSRC